MTKKQRNELTEEVVATMHRLNQTNASVGLISADYADRIFWDIARGVVNDLKESSDNWNDDDVRLAVGRVLIDMLNIEL